MYHRVRKKMFHFFSAILILSFPLSLSTPIDVTTTISTLDDNDVNNNIIDFDEEYTVKFNKKYGMVPWHANDYNKNSLKYTIVKDNYKYNDKFDDKVNEDKIGATPSENLTTEDYRVIPLELISTTDDPLIRLVESTNEPDLTVIPLSTTEKIQITVEETVKLPSTENAENSESSTERFEDKTTEHFLEGATKQVNDFSESSNVKFDKVLLKKEKVKENLEITGLDMVNATETTTHKQNDSVKLDQTKSNKQNRTRKGKNRAFDQIKILNTTITPKETTRANFEKDDDVPIFTELDAEHIEDIPEDYYDAKDTVPTPAPKTDALSVLFGLAGSVVESVVESVAEKVVPKSIYDLFKRMQKQNEALEAERLRSREENGGLGQFGRGILKSISSGLSKPLTQLMESRANGSLDTDHGFVGGVAASVTSVANVANSVVDAFKDKVQAIYPGTVWCGDGRSAQARSSDLGLFFFTDTCCRQHDACKLYIGAGDSKYGLTNTGLFTRSHCSCDSKFRACLHRTNSLVSAQIGLTYFNVLGPQCFRRAHPIVKCLKKTRITGLKCEEYELDYTKPKMWQWFDNETF